MSKNYSESIKNIYPQPGTLLDRNNARPNSDSYSYSPFQPTYQERKKYFLQFCVNHYPNSLIGESARACLDEKGVVSDRMIDLYVKRLNERFDCADFFGIHIIYALHINQKHQFLRSNQLVKLRQALLNFKYWADEPGHNYMIMYTENHQILFHSIEYLAGQLLPDQIFRNNGKSGKWHQDHAAKLALQWMERRARWGFSEWSSNVYFSKDVEALLLLAEFSEDDSFAKASAITLDLVLLEIACNQFYGFHSSTHGRAYENEILSGWDCEVASLVKLIWGLGTFNENGTTAALLLASATRYTPPEIIIRIGQEICEEFTNYERNGIPIEKLGQHGINVSNLDDVNFIWGMAAFSQPEVIDLFVKACDKWNLWKLPFFDFLDEQQREFLPRDGTLGKITKKLNIDFNRTLLGEVNMITFKTPEYMLSTAQDYRPGGLGYQHHIWQATLSPNAVIFTTNPGATSYTQDSISPDKLEYEYIPIQKNGEKIPLNRLPSYWAGQNRLPRAVQYKNIAFILYNINMKKAVGESLVYDFSHAFFPKWAFDEIIEEKNWVFGRLGKGYAALYSAVHYLWNNPDNPFVHDIMVKGKKNIWLCHMGNEKQYGSFNEFIHIIQNNKLNIKLESLYLEYHDISVGTTSFSWKSPLLIDDKEIPISDYDRMNNPYCYSEFDSGIYKIEQNYERLILDVKNFVRKIEPIE